MPGCNNSYVTFSSWYSMRGKVINSYCYCSGMQRLKFVYFAEAFQVQRILQLLALTGHDCCWALDHRHASSKAILARRHGATSSICVNLSSDSGCDSRI